VFENLLVYGRYFGLADTLISSRIPELLQFAGLEGRADSRIQTLSGGMKRRLSLARALVNDPDLLVLDEPTTGLDPQARHLIWERLKQLVARGKTILLTTHFMDEAERLCHRVAVMDNGRLIADGSPRDLIARNIEPEVVEVYGDAADAWARGAGATACERVERIGETVFCYTRNDERVLATLEGKDELRYLHRRANLEDVFPEVDWTRSARLNAHAAKIFAAPQLSRRFAHVWRRNFLVWRKLAIPSVLGNLADPMLYMLGLGYGLGTLLPQVDGTPYITFLAAGTVCYSTMNSATFEALYSDLLPDARAKNLGCDSEHTPMGLDDVVLAEVTWAASKSLLSGSRNRGHHLGARLVAFSAYAVDLSAHACWSV
jgi:hypothetical protein